VFAPFFMFWEVLFALAFALAAVRWGGLPERLIASIWLVWFAVLEPLALYFFLPVAGFNPDFGAVPSFFTGFGFFAITGIAIYANRFYPMCIAAIYLLFYLGLPGAIADAAFFAPVVDQILIVLAYLFGVIGLAAHRRREIEFGQYRDWSPVRWPL